MVVFYLRNSKAPDDKVVPVTISLQLDPTKAQPNPSRSDQFPTATGTEFPNLLDQEGDRIWLLVVAPPRSELDKDTGLAIPPEIINVISEDTLHEEIESAMGRIGDRIEWPPLLSDTSPPQLASITPSLDQTSNVNIFSNITYRIVEPLPAAGLDLTTLNMKINGLPVITSGVVETGENVQFKGNIFDFQVIHKPKRDFN